MEDRYISKCYIKEKWSNLVSNMEALMRSAGDHDRIPVESADRLKCDIQFNMDAIIKEIFGDL